MSMSTLFYALLTAIIVWILLVRHLTAKPWIVTPEGEQPEGVIGPVDQPAKRVALWTFLAVVSSLFLLFFTAYYMRMDPHHGADWASVSKPGLLWANTGILVLSSLAMQWAKNAVAKGDLTQLQIGLLAGGALTVVFLLSQLWAWRLMAGEAGYDLRNPATAFFYLLTGVHGLHLIGGLWVWARTTIKSLKRVELESIGLSVELCTVYWHFLLLVWLGLFALLMST